MRASSSSAREPGVALWYTLAWTLGLPLAATYLLWRSLRQPEYRRHWAERFFGRGPVALPTAQVFWVHAVSVGETRAAQPLIAELAQRHPQARFVLTHMTPTGRAAGADLVGAFPGRIEQRYLPYDLPFAVQRFLDEIAPSIGILMETEIWPNLLRAAAQRSIPVVLVNARLSERSLAKAARSPRLFGAAAARLAAVAAQTEADRARIARIFGGTIVVTGNCKFDLQPDLPQRELGAALRAQFGAVLGARPIWLFASTREGEERMIVEALATPVDGPAPLLLFVPRHPQRFAEVGALLAASGRQVLRRANWEGGLLPAGRTDPAAASASLPILLGDSMGEMVVYYAMADVALIGGSLVPLGGQNLIEACASGCPVVLGPHMFNFAQAADDALAAGAARRVDDARQALRAMAQICRDDAVRQKMIAAALAFAALHRGATARTVEVLEEVLGQDRIPSAAKGR